MRSIRFSSLSILASVLVTVTPDISDAAAPIFADAFTEHMVLQRDQPLRVWGKSDANARIIVTLANQKAETTAGADGSWQATLPAVAAGGPFELTATTGGESARLADVLVGDVWLCSGQSNMQYSLKNSIDAKAAIAAAGADRNLRYRQLPMSPKDKPTDQNDAKWKTADAKTAADISAVAVHFALALRESPALKDVPIGLIDSSYGGTRVEAWVPLDAMKGKFNPADLKESGLRVQPGQLFNGMIAPLGGLNLRGALWYQGESNTPRPDIYADLLDTMIAEWRATFKDADLPFYVVQLPNYPHDIEGYSYAFLREAEATVAQRTKNVKMAVTIDTPDGYDLHPGHKKMVGERLALLARRHTYGETTLIADSPTFRSADSEGQSMRVTFDTHGSSLKVARGGLLDFELSGEDGNFVYAQAKLDGPDAVIVQADAVPRPKFVRYAFMAAPHASLTNADGLPAAPFRTDRQPATPMLEVQEAPTPRRVVTKNYTATLDVGGWLTGLMVDGHQMLNPHHTGGFVPLGGFGPFKLRGPFQTSATDIYFEDGIKFSYHFDADAIRIDVFNGWPDGSTPVRLMLANDLKPSTDFAAGKPVLFQRGNTQLIVEGADGMSISNEGNPDLQTQVKAGTTRTVVIRIRK